MNKKKIFFILIIILIAIFVAYLYFGSGTDQEDYKIYTAEDFPDALQMMTQEVLELNLEGLNEEYRLLREEDHIYIRWINIGILKKRLGDINGIEEAWQNAVSYNPDQSLAFGNLAHLYFYDFKQYDKAEEYYKIAIEKSTANYQYYIGLADLYRYKITEKKNQIEILLLEGVSRAVDRNMQADIMFIWLSILEKKMI